MTNMDIQAEKLEVMRLILETDNPSIIASIKKLFKKDPSSDFWNSLTQDQKDEIIEGLDELDQGKTINYEDIMRKHRG